MTDDSAALLGLAPTGELRFRGRSTRAVPELLSTSVYPHGHVFGDPGVAGSSLDHALWFHWPPRVDEWLVHEMESLWANGARALCVGHFFSLTGELVATVLQEGLLRFGS